MYRKCVLVVLYDFEKQLFFVAKRSHTENGWQFVQGGVDVNESLNDAAVRELFEETGIKTNEFDATVGPYCYDYPKYVKRKEKGQEQIWFLKKIKIENITNVVLNHEFSNYQWKDIKFVLENIVDFKKNVYQCALKDLGFAIQ